MSQIKLEAINSLPQKIFESSEFPRDKEIIKNDLSFKINEQIRTYEEEKYRQELELEKRHFLLLEEQNKAAFKETELRLKVK